MQLITTLRIHFSTYAIGKDQIWLMVSVGEERAGSWPIGDMGMESSLTPLEGNVKLSNANRFRPSSYTWN